MSNLIRCQSGHMFSGRRDGMVCPYCNFETTTKEKKETGQTEIEVEEALFLQEEHPVCGWIVCIEGLRRGKKEEEKGNGSVSGNSINGG